VRISLASAHHSTACGGSQRSWVASASAAAAAAAAAEAEAALAQLQQSLRGEDRTPRQQRGM